MISNVDIKDWTELFGNETLVNVPRDSVISFVGSPFHFWHFRRLDGVWAHIYDYHDTERKTLWYANPLTKVKVWAKNDKGN